MTREEQESISISLKRVSITTVITFVGSLLTVVLYVYRLDSRIEAVSSQAQDRIVAHERAEHETFRRYDTQLDTLEKKNDRLIDELRDMRGKIDKIYEMIVERHK